MRTYIALLRGINVGGHIVKMDRLRGLFEQQGFTNVRSYIQSGNVFFESEEDKLTLQENIETMLAKELGFAVPTVLRTIDELEKILKRNPFEKVTLSEDKRFAITFLSKPTDIYLEIPFVTPDGGYEVIYKTDEELFVVWHLKNGRPANSYGAIEKKLQVPATTRFWHTTQKILDAAKKKI